MLDKIINLLSFLAFLTLIFLGGFAIAFFRVYPYDTLSNAFNALEVAYKLQHANLSESFFVWPQPNAYIGKSGVTVHLEDKTYGDYTLYSPSTEQAAYLLNMRGEEVHKWSKPFSESWDNPPHIEKPVRDNKIIWRGLYLYPNGDLLAVYNAVETSPYSYGIVKLDKDSNIIWKYSGYAHHDIDVGEDGNVYTLTNEITTEKINSVPHLKPPLFDEYVTILSAAGEDIKSISIYDAFSKSEHFSEVASYFAQTERLDISTSNAMYGDIIHPNTVRYINAEDAQRQPLFKEGQLLLSLREHDIIAVLDPVSEAITWAVRGFWRAQHSPVMTENGHILIFDNDGPQTTPRTSRVLEYDPVSEQVTWSYQGTPQRPFYSSVRSAVQALPGGNVLVTSYENGRIYEISRDKEIVWEFFTSKTLDGDPSRISGVHSAFRYTADELPFLKATSEK